MALYAISDLHLPSKLNKPMDRFGSRWQGYTEKIRKRWNALVDEGDTVVVPGDISWAMTLTEAADDFRFIESLKGKKLIGKGNHDYWWDSGVKMRNMLASAKAGSVSFLQNNAYLLPEEGYVVCGSRGWFIEERLQSPIFDSDYTALINRERARLALSLDEGERLKAEYGVSFPILVFLHFPPVFGDFVCEPIVEEMLSHSVSRCFFGHIHGKYDIPPEIEYRGIKMEIISSDYLDFYPKKIV